jgi:hypothetical protein
VARDIRLIGASRTHDGLHRARAERNNLRGDKAHAAVWIWVANSPAGCPQYPTMDVHGMQKVRGSNPLNSTFFVRLFEK